MRNIIEVILLGAIFGLCGYAITQIIESPATCQQVLQ